MPHLKSLIEYQGNIKFREVVDLMRPEYLSTNKRKAKDSIAHKAIQIIKLRKGRFLRKLHEEETKPVGVKGDVYVCADERVVIEKTKQALRFLGRKKTEAFFSIGNKEDKESRTTQKVEKKRCSAGILQPDDQTVDFLEFPGENSFRCRPSPQSHHQSFTASRMEITPSQHELVNDSAYGFSNRGFAPRIPCLQVPRPSTTSRFIVQSNVLPYSASQASLSQDANLRVREHLMSSDRIPTGISSDSFIPLIGRNFQPYSLRVSTALPSMQFDSAIAATLRRSNKGIPQSGKSRNGIPWKLGPKNSF